MVRLIANPVNDKRRKTGCFSQRKKRHWKAILGLAEIV